MFAMIDKSRLLVVVCATLVVLAITSWAKAAVSGSFVAVLNEATSNADSRKSVTFYDAADINGGPLFSVFVPFEIHGTSSTAYEEPQTVTTNPSTGDMYFLAFKWHDRRGG